MTQATNPTPPDVSTKRRLLTLGVLMAAASTAGILLKPKTRANKELAPAFDLEAAVPRRFGDWQEQAMPVQAINPQTQELLDKLYSQILGRSYVNREGYVIMLSLSYGADQRGSMEAHKPEVCYPAQGFTVNSNEGGSLSTDFGPIDVRRLETQLGARHEPLTYWFTVGNSTVQSRLDKRLVELRLALTGQVPDGLLFRVSSIDTNADKAWQMQQSFVNDLLKATSPAIRARLAGVTG